MKKRSAYILLLTLLLTACATTKNTGLTRSYHGMKVVHNVYFNGSNAFREGLAAIDKANEDDYTTILNLYPISNPKAQQAAGAQMDKSIEKCRKCIKLHSIHVRPKKINPRKRRDPQYKLWLESKEFNAQMWRAWMLLAESEFHKGDFLGSVGTFSYVARLYENDPDLVAQCQLWTARAYAEMGWQYEAEETLNKVKVDHLKRKHQSLYSAVSADILLKGQHFREAIPFVKIAKADEKRKLYKPRFEYVLAQLYQEQGQRDAARAGYKRVIRLQPEHIMRFNAQLRYYELLGDTTKSVRYLLRLAKQDKNKKMLDQIYGTVGNIYLHHNDTATALKYYQMGIDQSTENSKDKAGVLLQAGDLYYERKAYTEAAPCYTEAVQIISHDDVRYPEADKRSQALAEIMPRVETIALQDSLQHLSTLSEEDLLAVIDTIIAHVIAKEQADSIQAQEQERKKELGEDDELIGVNTEKMIGGFNRDQSWYFYNESLLKKGKQQFQKQWGDRPLEDNWRRSSKTQTTSGSEATGNEFQEGLVEDLPADSLPADSTAEVPVTDIHTREYYLQQIPRTDEDFAASNLEIADALYDLVSLYREKVNDQQMSDLTFEEFCRRFPNDERLLDLYYMQYLTALRHQEEEQAETYRQDILRLFPDSREARILSDPDYAASLRETAAVQDSIYEATYLAWKKGDYATVKQNTQTVEQNYPLSSLMPRFLFLNAVGVARTENQTAFVDCLQNMIARYPEHELSAMAKNMLALIGEGQQSQKGGAMGTLQEQREQEDATADEAEQQVHFSDERKTASYVLVLIAHDEQALGQMLYQVAVFNFTQFLVKDFDMQSVGAFSREQSALQISGFDSMDEAEWYIGLMQEDTALSAYLTEAGAEIVPITEENYKLLGTLSFEDYLQLQK